MARDPTLRFGDRVAAYVRARPDYPQALLPLLGPPGVAADVGAGTGLLSQRLLEGGWEVRAVEPNPEMAGAALEKLGHHPGFRLVEGRAEDLPLASASVDLITAGQAFHWFDPVATRTEWLRVLAPEGGIALIWNDRATEESLFLQGYEALLREFGTDYRRVHHRNMGPDMLDTFFGGPWHEAHLPHEQILDRDRLRDRLLSCSYVPTTGDPRHGPMLTALDRLFDRHSRDGVVVFPYRTRVCRGQIRADVATARARRGDPG